MLPATYTSVVIEKAPETGNYLRQSVLQFPRRPARFAVTLFLVEALNTN
jgi:hypothetical protein